ncbi:MAG: Jag N-terminal domain-containing protein [Deltaproteobacteria bacterium]|nr:Jag N-terminal domain-containing protein [Deltaproteobacteria bacterium]
MSPSLEFEDKNVEMAVKKACEKLNIPREKLQHDVISYGSSGIFGLVGTKKARIRVILPKPIIETDSDEVKLEKPENLGFEHALENKDIPIDAKQSEQMEQVVAPDPRDLGREALQRIIDLITIDATVSVQEETDRISFQVKGGNAAILIGKHGQTLEAIQYIVEKIVNKQQKERVRIYIDIEGYLKNRRIGLQKLATRMAEKVKRTGKPATIDPMNAHDRRIVHIALKDDSKVRTQSVGEGFIRKLVILPKRDSYRKKRSD